MVKANGSLMTQWMLFTLIAVLLTTAGGGAATAQPGAKTHCDHLARIVQIGEDQIRPYKEEVNRYQGACRPGYYLSGRCRAYRRAQNRLNQLAPQREELRRAQLNLQSCRDTEQARHDLERLQRANAEAAEAARRQAEEEGEKIRRQAEAAAERARQQAEALEAASAADEGSSSGSTIAAVGGAALLAGGLAWLLWRDAKSTIQPWAQGRNDGLGYVAGIQMRVAPCLSLRLYQTDGPTELRFTGADIEFRW